MTNPSSTKTTETGGTNLENMKAIAGGDVTVYPDMPAIGEKALLESVFGRLVHPHRPTADQELDIGKITKTEFDGWHQMQWEAGKIRRAV